MSDDAIEDLRQIRMSLSYTEDRIVELKEQINKRIYCVEVTTNVVSIVKVLAKNEDDAVEWATDVADKRVDLCMCQYDYERYSEGYSLGDESIEDDEAEEEYPYDD